MLTLHGKKQIPPGGRFSRRDFLHAGALGVGGLTLADLLGARANANPGDTPSRKSVIMIYLCGAPPHQDMYDLKPDAPVEYRGEFRPIRTNVPGIDICELMPLQAKIADKLALVRNMRAIATDSHMPEELLSGFPYFPDGGPRSIKQGVRPTFGSVISKLYPKNGTNLPPYVSLDMGKMPHGTVRLAALEPAFLGTAYQPFDPSGPGGVANLGLPDGMTRERVGDRQTLRGAFDTLRRDLETTRGVFDGMDSFTAQALDIITSPRVRDAFDVSREPEKVRNRYGALPRFLQARRLAEAGVAVVSVLGPGYWDTHSDNFKTMRKLLPLIDQGIHALVTDLHDRGLDKDVAVVVWGEYGRTPKINKAAGRDHWPHSSFALVAGGGFKMGQAIGATSDRAERPVGGSYIPQNLLATLYRELFGIDPATTVPDHSGRPVYLLDEWETIKELI
jgi:hypothetical protein